MADISAVHRIDITAKDSTGGAFASVISNVNGLGRELDGVSRAMQLLTGIGGGLVGMLSAATFTNMISGAIEAQARLVDLATMVGTTASALMALQPAAALSNTSMDLVAQASAKFSKSLIDVQAGVGKGAEAFKALGFSAQDAARFLESPSQGLLELAQHLNTFGDSGAKTAAVMELLGRSGEQLLPFLHQLGEQQAIQSQLTDQQLQAAHRLEDSWAELGLAATALKNSIAQELIPGLADATNNFLAAQKAGFGFFASLQFAGLDNSKIVDTISDVNAKIRELQGDLAKAQASKASAASALLGSRFVEEISKDGEALDGLMKKVKTLQQIRDQGIFASLSGSYYGDARDQALKDSAASLSKGTLAFSPATAGVDQFAAAMLQANKIVLEAQIALNNLGLAAQDQAAPALKNLADIMMSPAWAAYKAAQQQRIVDAYEEAAAIQGATAAQKADLDQQAQFAALAEQLQGQASGFATAFAGQLQILTNEYVSGRESLEQYRDLVQKLLDQQPFAQLARQTQAAVERINASYRDFLGSIEQANQDAQRQLDLLGQAPDVIARSNAEYQAQAVVQREISQLTNDWIEATAKGQTVQADAILANLNDILDRQGRIVQSAGDYAVKLQQAGVRLEAWKGVFTSLADEGASFIENFVTKGSSAFRTLWDDFKTWALQAFAKIAAQTIVVNIAEALVPSAAGIAANTFAGGGNGLMSLLTGGSNTLGSGGSILSGLSNLGTLSGLTSLGSGGIFAAGGALSGFATGAVGQALGLSTAVGVNASLGAATAGLTAFGTAMGAVIPVLGAVVAVAGLLGAFDKKPSPVKGQFMVSPGTSGFEDNAYVPSAFGNLGFNDANTQQFSGQAAKVFDSVVAGAIDAFNSRFSPEQSAHFADVLKTMTFKTFEGTFTTQDFLQKYGGQVLQQVVTAAFQILDPALASVVAGFKGTADQVATFSNSLLQIYDITKQIGNSDFTANVDAALQGATQATADKVLAFTQIVAGFGAAIPAAGTQLEKLSGTDIPAFIDALGGASAALNSVNYIYANFTTSAQKTADASTQLNLDFAALGLSVPKSHQAFLDLLNSMDLTTQSGREMYAKIAALAPLFVQVYGTADQAATALNNAAGAMNTVTTAAQQITVSVGELTNAGIKDANKLLSNVQQLANAGTGDFGDKLSTQISLIASAIKATGATLSASGSYYYPNPGGAAGEQTASYLDQLDQTYLQLTSDLGRYTVLAAQYGSAQAEQLVQLQDWLTQQNKLFSGNADALAAVQVIYQQKWDSIIAGTASGVSGAIDQLQKLRDGIAQYLQGLLVGNLSPLAPMDQLAQAQSQFQAELAKAQGGDQGAMGDITKFADTYLNLARGAYASSSAYTSIFNAVTGELGALAAPPPTATAASPTAQLAAALPVNGTLASSTDVSQVVAALNDLQAAVATSSQKTQATYQELIAALANSNSADAQAIIKALGGGKQLTTALAQRQLAGGSTATASASPSGLMYNGQRVIWADSSA